MLVFEVATSLATKFAIENDSNKPTLVVQIQIGIQIHYHVRLCFLVLADIAGLYIRLYMRILLHSFLLK